MFQLQVTTHGLNKLRWSADARTLLVGDAAGTVHILRVAPEVRPTTAAVACPCVVPVAVSLVETSRCLVPGLCHQAIASRPEDAAAVESAIHVATVNAA